MQDGGDNVPATNIDDVRISIIDDDQEKHQREVSEKQKHDKSESAKSQKGSSPNNKTKDGVPRDSQKQRESAKSHQRSVERNEHRKSETRNGHEPEPIHIQLGRADSNYNTDSRSGQDISRSRESSSKMPDGHENSTKMAPNPHIQQLQGSANVKRTGSFQKRSESQRRRSMEHLGGDAESHEDQVRYPTGTPSGTLSDLKKARAEQHKFGSTDGMVANLFLQSLSTDSKKYSSGSATSPPQANIKDKAQNGRASTKPNINNNTTPGQRNPPTYISDSGPLRKFSAPASSPVIGEDDKFKNECCVIL